MSWFEHAGSKIYYEDAGSGDPVLVLPGITESIDDVAQIRTALAQKYRVVAADPPGSGRSGPQPREYTKSYYQDDARSFLALLESLSTGPAHLIGFSDGGEYELVMAELQPSAVRSIAVWGAAGKLEAAPELIEMFANIVDSPTEEMTGFSDHLKASYGEANARAMLQSAANAWRAIIAAGGDISLSRSGEISCPVLLITGEHDFLAPPALVRQLAAAIPNAEFVEVKDASHDVQATHAQWLSETITGWLAKH